MKKIFLIGSLLALACACDDGSLYFLPDGDKYDNLYLVQASSGTQEVNLMSSQESWSTSFNAFYSSLSSPVDINMTFAVDNSLIEDFNELYSSDCIALPEGSYTLGSNKATIKAGEYRTSLIPIDVDVKALETEVSYLLPIKMTVSGNNVKVNEDLNTIYYRFFVNIDRSPVAIEGKIDDCDEFFNFNNACILTRNRATGELKRYTYDPEALKIEGPTVLASDWTSANVRWIEASNNHTLHLVNTGYTWYAINCSEDGSTVGAWNVPAANITGGCSIFMDTMMCEAPLDGYYGIWAGSGNLAYYQLSANGLALTGVISHTNPGDGSDLRAYNIRFVYNGDIYGIDSEGNLWRYPWNSTTHAIGARTQVGSGWGKFTHVTTYNDQLIMRQSGGDCVKIDFDPTVFWGFTE